jgi:hypothetical protein
VSAALTEPLVEGTQTPRVFSAPPAASYASADEALDFAVACGIVLDPWQRLAVRTALAEAADGRWAAFEFALFVARQNGKGEVIMVLELAKLFLFRFGRPALILHSAHLFQTAQEAWRRIRDVVDGVDWLRKEVRRMPAAHGEEGIELNDGARLRFMARTISGGGRGFSPTDLFFDEVFRLPMEALAANLPALSAQRNPQISYFASAGYPDSAVQWRLVERGRAGNDPTLGYMEFSPEPGAGLDDVQTWVDTNPGMGYRPGLTVETIRRERLTLPDEEFARERCSMWASTDLDRLIDRQRWAELADGISEPCPPFVYGIDVSADRVWSTLAIAGDRPDGAVHVAVQYPARGTEWVVDKCLELRGKYPGARFAIDASSGPAESLLPALRASGLPLVELGAGDVRKACGMFVDAVTQGTLRHRGQPLLSRAVEGAKPRLLGDGGFAFGRKRSDVDISPLNAACYAHWALMTNRPYKVLESIW